MRASQISRNLRPAKGCTMCSQCHRTRRRRAAVVACLPILLIAQPLGTGLVNSVHGGGSDTPTYSTLFGGEAFAAEAKASTDPDLIKYTCPMHPHYIADEMGTCPICGMDLVKLETGDSLGSTAGEGRTVITVASETIQ